MTEWIYLGISIVLIVVCGVFVAGEFSLLAADRPAVETAARQGDRRSAGVLAALRTLSTQLSGVQLAITLTNLAVGFLSEPAISSLLHGPLTGVGIGGTAADTIAVVLGLVISTVLTMLFGELVPKNIAIAIPTAVAGVVQAPVRAFTRAMRWPIRALNYLADSVLGVFGLQAQEELASARTPDELVSLVRRSASEGTLAPGTATLFMATLSFADKHAADVMTPRPRVVSVPLSSTVAELLDAVRDTGHARLPVTASGDLDEIVGVVELDQAVGVPRDRRDDVTVGAIMRPAVVVPHMLPLDDLLSLLRERRSQIAVVWDEYGGTAGVVTGEDLIEELVGDLDDEHDTPASPAVQGPDGWRLSGLLRPDEVRALTGLDLPDGGPYDTVGGLIMHRLGRIATVGDVLEVGDVRLTVAAMEGRRIDQVLAVSEHADAAPVGGASR